MSRTLRAGLAAACVALVAGTVMAVASPAYAATATFVKTSSWGSGFEGKFTIVNNTSTTITSWNVQFDLPAGTSVSSSWDTAITRSGQHYTAVNTWNGTLAPGGSTSFGFIGAGSGSPANCTVNGAACGGGTPPSSPPPPGTPGTPGAPSIGTVTNSAISLSWGASSGTVTGYRVYEGSTVRATVTATSATISGLGACTAHTYAVRAYNAQGESPASSPASATTTGCVSGGTMAAAPYLYLGWGNPPAPATVMSATGVKWFTMAFMLSGGGCTPAWDSSRPLLGGVDASTIAAIRAAGGDIVPSFGGWSGNKLGPNCATAQALAGAYQQVINAYSLKAIDIDIENSDEFENEVVQDRILNALKIVKQNNPGIKTIITFGTSTTGPNYWGARLINQSAALGANIDVFTIMPFDFGGGANMATSTISASEGLKNALKAAYGWSDAVAYTHMGISGMNGLSDQQELTSLAHWQTIRDYAQNNHLGRLAFWSVNRDRGCAGGGVTSDCSGIAQANWAYTAITATFNP
jgi:hypothetical protein